MLHTLTSYLQVYHTLRDCVTSFRSRPHPKLPYTLLPVSATNPLRPRFTLSPYLIPLKPQLPSWLLTEHDSLWTALVINNSPVVRSVSPAAGHPHVPHWCVREATLCFFTSSVSCFGLRGGIRTFHLFVSVAGTEVPSDVATFALPHEFCPRSLHNFVRKLKNRWRIGLPYFNIRTTQNRNILVWKARPLQDSGQQLIWWARKQKASYLLSVRIQTPALTAWAHTVPVSVKNRWTLRHWYGRERGRERRGREHCTTGERTDFMEVSTGGKLEPLGMYESLLLLRWLRRVYDNLQRK